MTYKNGDKVKTIGGCGVCGLGSRTVEKVNCSACPLSCKIPDKIGTINYRYGSRSSYSVIFGRQTFEIREDYLRLAKANIEKMIEAYDAEV